MADSESLSSEEIKKLSLRISCLCIEHYLTDSKLHESLSNLQKNYYYFVDEIKNFSEDKGIKPGYLIICSNKFRTYKDEFLDIWNEKYHNSKITKEDYDFICQESTSISNARKLVPLFNETGILESKILETDIPKVEIVQYFDLFQVNVA